MKFKICKNEKRRHQKLKLIIFEDFYKTNNFKK